ncbi:aspartate kinase [Streptomyces sp. Ru71]|uniref:aspartate kinase n=1 Tax=Streptomyces sp. Ru71 TaxID=2080746 RepID=UPI000CDD3D59|nr:aspartate kinase [Streptomyces sp. Ru71]POX48598.1 aspartate kinase [Streptomyces sp. Ru71]
MKTPGAGPTTGTVVQKYGGSSLATPEHLHKVAQRVAATAGSGRRVAVVVSAQGKTTDRLLGAAHEINPHPAGRELDLLLATGETASASLTAMALQRLGVAATALSGAHTGILGTGPHGAGVVAAVDTERVEGLLAAGHVVVIAGFQAVGADGELVTLGRGGSDTTAVAVAAELGAGHCEIYTDVPGVLTADPRLVPGARLLPELDMDVMAEMAFAGAKVMHSRAVELAALCGIDIHVGHAAGRDIGTRIHANDGESMLETRTAVVAVVHDQNVAQVTVRTGRALENPAREIFRALDRQAVPADMTTVVAETGGGHAVTLTVPHTRVEAVRRSLAEHAGGSAGAVTVDESVATVSIVGKGLLSRPRYAARMLDALTGRGIHAGSLTASQSRVSVTVPQGEVGQAVRLLHTEFGLDAPQDSGSPVLAVRP